MEQDSSSKIAFQPNPDMLNKVKMWRIRRQKRQAKPLLGVNGISYVDNSPAKLSGSSSNFVYIFVIVDHGINPLSSEIVSIFPVSIMICSTNDQIIHNSVVSTMVATEVKSIDGYTISETNRTQAVEVKPDDT